MPTLTPKQALNFLSDHENWRIKIVDNPKNCSMHRLWESFVFLAYTCVHFGVVYLDLTVSKQLLTEINPKVGKRDPTTPQSPLCWSVPTVKPGQTP